MLADKRRDAGIDQGLEFSIIDGRQREIEDVDCPGADGGEIAMKEDQMEDA
jgi:hypothetical protein